MSRRLLVIVAAVGLVAAACSKPPTTTIDFGSGDEFVPQVVDHLNNTGSDPSIVLSSDGTPYLTYFSFPEQLQKGDIPVARPLNFPQPLPVISLAGQNTDGVWLHGAAAVQAQPTSPIQYAFGPAIEPDIRSMEPANVNGTATTIDGSGGLHIVWTADTGIWYASNAGATSFSTSTIVKQKPSLHTAGPLGWPSIAVDRNGDPWVAFTMNSAKGGQQVEVATPKGKGWATQVVATIPPCGGCPPPQRTAIGVTPDGQPLVAFVDNGTGDVEVARLEGKSWKVETVDTGAGGTGLSMAVTKDGTPVVAYYAGSSVNEARSTGTGSWTVTKVADVGKPTSFQLRYMTTALAVDDTGRTLVAWYDPTPDEVLAALSSSGSYKPVALRGTLGGANPALAVKPDGSEIFLAWYDHENQVLQLGTIQNADNIELAVLSPSPVYSPPPASPVAASCKPGNSTTLTLDAPAGASTNGFKETCLAIRPNVNFQIDFNNQEAGIPHNLEVFNGADASAPSLGVTQTITGPAKATLKLKPLKAGDYFYHCQIHPTTMTGTLVVG